MVALRLIEAINAWDLDAARSVCDTDRYLEHNPAWGSTRFEDMLRAYTLIRASLPDLSFVSNTDLIVGEGDRVVVSGTVVGTHTGAPLFGVPASGKKLEWTGIDIARVTDGRITERWLCADILRLVQQLGLTPGN